MQPELAKAVVAYGLNRSLPTYGQPEPLQAPPPKIIRGTAHGHAVGTAHSVYIMELSFSAAASVVDCTLSQILGGPEVAIHPTPPPRPQGRPQTRTSPVVLFSARASDRAPERRHVSLDLEDFQ